MDRVKCMLQTCLLDRYIRVFEEQGYDSMEHLMVMGPTDFEQLQSATGMLSGHLHRLKQSIEQEKLRAQHTTSSGYTGTSASDASACGPMMGPPPFAAAVEAQPAVASRAQKETEFGKITEFVVPLIAQSKFRLKGTYPEWKDAKLASEQYNTLMGCSVVQDSTKSGSRKKIFRCRCVLSKRKLGQMDEGPRPKCPHVMVWNKKKGNWVLNQKQSHLGHVPFCHSGQHVSAEQLVHDPKFVKHVQTEKKCTGPTAYKNALGHMGRLDGCMSVQTARRARNKINHFTDQDYDDDWCKLKGWARDFEAKNPNSRCIFDEEETEDGQKRSGPGPMQCPMQCSYALCNVVVGPHFVYVPQVQANVRERGRLLQHCLRMRHAILCPRCRVLQTRDLL